LLGATVALLLAKAGASGATSAAAPRPSAERRVAHVERNGSFNALAAPSIASTEIKRAARIDMPKNHESGISVNSILQGNK
jgi:hypothetical protein